MKVSHPRTKVLARLQLLKRASIVLASHVVDGVAPPLQLSALELKGEEDDDSGNGDAAGPCCREHKVVLEGR